MKVFIHCFLSLLFGFTCLLAGDVERKQELLEAYVTGDLSEEDAVRFATQAAFHYEETLEQLSILKYSENPKVSPEALNKAIQKLKKANGEVGNKEVNGELQLAPYVVMKGDQFSALPLVKRIGKASSAYKAGLRQGDVIRSVAGHGLMSLEAVMTMDRLLALWPEGKEMKVEVGRAKGGGGDIISRAEKTLRISIKIL